MPSARKTETADEARERGKRLRELKESVRSLGKRGLEDTFAAGKALEEAAALLRGSYSSWVKTECGLEPRTALGFRKTFRVLGHVKETLLEQNVSASVAMLIAAAKPEGRERALAAIASGRTLSVRDAKNALAVGTWKQREPRPAAVDAFSCFLRQRCEDLVDEASRIVALASLHGKPDETTVMEIALRAKAIQPILSILGLRTKGSARVEEDPLLKALGEVAAKTEAAASAEAVWKLAELTTTVATSPTDTATATAVAASGRPSSSWRDDLTSSPFRHGLTSFEICAGAGGQAAGLAKAGFRHVGLLEHNPIACGTLRAAFGEEHVIQADLVGYEPDGVEGIDLLAGGVPCQPFSQSGQRKGAEDSRDMFPEALRLVERLRPRAVMLENVKGLMEERNDTYRFAIQAKLKRLGYDSEWRVVDASHFGVPQKRIRAILVAFREPEAMARFVWPAAWMPQHKHEPYPIVAALIDQLQSRGWTMPSKMRLRMDRAANTILGGSNLKQGADLGQRNGSMHWVEMGVIRTRIADDPPAPGHVGDVALTNRMLATLQGFPIAWPFAGKKVEVFRQIGNAFPPPVATHLGCAIASALTGKFLDPARYYVHEGRKRVYLPRDHRAPGTSERNASPPTNSDDRSLRIPMNRLPAAAISANEVDPAIRGFESRHPLQEESPRRIPLDVLGQSTTGSGESDPDVQGFEKWWYVAEEPATVPPQQPPA